MPAILSALNQKLGIKKAYLCDVSVIPGMRKHGLGNHLLLLAEKEARNMDAETLWLWVAPRTWKVGWYERHGYEKQYIDIHGNHVMCKTLQGNYLN